jgi:hypothetical protein
MPRLRTALPALAAIATSAPVLTATATAARSHGATAAHGVTASQAIRWLNAQRADNGIPPGITDDREWNEGCRLHIAWWAKNPHAENPHIETPGTPGYTTLGAFAGAHAVLAEGIDWARSEQFPWGAADPWESAPIHLMQLLAPELSVTGFAPVCMITWSGYERTPPAEPELLTYPGAGTSFAAPSENAEEWPFTPADFVGLKQGGTTGPYLYVLGWGTGTGRITDASLTGPKGNVPLKTVDDFTTGKDGDLGSYLPPGGMLIPAKPLKPGAKYTSSVTFAPAPAIVEIPAPQAGPDEITFPGYEIRDELSKLSPSESRTEPAPLSLTWSFRTAGASRHRTAGRGGTCTRRQRNATRCSRRHP